MDGQGEVDSSRRVSYVGQAQILTPMGSVPLAFEIDAESLEEAARKFGAAAAGAAIAETQRELEDLRREAASSIVVPGTGQPGLGGGMPGGGMPGGKIKMP